MKQAYELHHNAVSVSTPLTIIVVVAITNSQAHLLNLTAVSHCNGCHALVRAGLDLDGLVRGQHLRPGPPDDADEARAETRNWQATSDGVTCARGKK